MAYDLDTIKNSHTLSEYIGRYVKLRASGSEMVGLSPFQKERSPSFFVVDHKGFWHDFSSNKHGDLIDFVCEYHNVGFQEACEILGGKQQAPTTRTAPKPAPIKEPPVQAVEIPDSHELFSVGDPIRAWNPKDGRWKTYRPDYLWAYKTQAGDLLGYVGRINLPDDKKIFVPFRYGRTDDDPRWLVAHLDRPRPMYGLDRFPVDHAGQIWLVEGERTADACRDLIGLPALSYGGANSADHTDFTPLKDRSVVIWGDADESGERAAKQVAQRVYEAGAALVKIVAWDHDKPKGWDAADAADGWSDPDTGEIFDPWDRATALAWARQHVTVWDNTEAPPEELSAGVVEAAPAAFDADPFTNIMPPPRPWAFGTMLLHRTVTAIAAPPGTGKSTWAIQLALAFSQHMEFGGMKPHDTGPVWIWNNEDDADELTRRTLASCMAMGINPANLDGHVYLNSGSDRQLIVAKEERGVIVATPDVDRVIQVIKDRCIRLLIVDPFSETFEAETENSNTTMIRVGALYRYIAQEGNCSVLLIGHTPKGQNGDKNAGSMDAFRGGSGLVGVARSVWTMFEMTDTDAETYGIEPERRCFYIRLDRAKGNMSAPSLDISWWQREGVSLDNSDDGNGDQVGVLVHCPFASRAQRAVTSREDYTQKIADEIVRVCRKNRYTSAKTGVSIDAITSVLDIETIGIKARAIKNIIIGQMNTPHTHGDAIICIEEIIRGAHTVRKIYVENR